MNFITQEKKFYERDTSVTIENLSSVTIGVKCVRNLLHYFVTNIVGTKGDIT